MKKIYKKISLYIFYLHSQMTNKVYAFEWIDDPPEKENKYIKDTKETINALSGSIFGIMRIVAYTAAIIILIIVGMKFVWKRNGQQNEENKSHLGYLIIGLIGAMSIGLIFEIASMIGNSLSDSISNNT